MSNKKEKIKNFQAFSRFTLFFKVVECEIGKHVPGELIMYYFLVNPSSCSGHGREIWSGIESYLKAADIEYKVFFSEYQGHVAKLMSDITSEHITDAEPVNVVILGGDGTMDEALQGIADFDRVNIGYIPTGSSNDFARALKWQEDPVELLRRILACKEPVQMDLGCLKYIEMSDERAQGVEGEIHSLRFFDVSCGIGFDAAICEEAQRNGSKSFLNRIGLGKLTYLVIALKQLLGAKLAGGTLILDGDEKVTFKRMRFIVGMNTCYEGGGFMFAPDADPTDGHLDICAVSDIGNLGVLMALPGASKGKHVKLKKIHIYRVKSYEVIMDEPVWVHTDGEVYVKARHIRVSVLPGKLRLLL